MDWLRLWHDMPNDPKWRTIARNCGEPVSLVITTYLHMLVDASRNVTRGHVTVTKEDLASALDVTETQILSILTAMESRVIENGFLLGWDKRQPKREDFGNPETGAKSAAERQAERRARQKQAALTQTSHDESRNVTIDEIGLEEIREDVGGLGTTAVDISPALPQISSEFFEVLKSRQDLDPAIVWSNFIAHYPPIKRSFSRWSKWVSTEHSPTRGKSATSSNVHILTVPSAPRLCKALEAILEGDKYAAPIPAEIRHKILEIKKMGRLKVHTAK